MSGKNPTGPRAGPSEAGESRTVSTLDTVCPTGYGGGNLASQYEIEVATSPSDKSVTSNLPGKVAEMGPPKGWAPSISARKGSIAGSQTTSPGNSADLDSDEESIIKKLVKTKSKRRNVQIQPSAELNKTVTNLEIDFTSDDDVNSEVNRKKHQRETTPTHNEMVKRSNQGPRTCNQKVIEDMCIKIEVLEKYIQKAHKPKGEIKNAILELSRTAKTIMDTRAGFSPKSVVQSGTCNCSVELENLRKENAELKVGLSDLECAMLEIQKSPSAENSVIAAKETANFIKRILDQQTKSKKGIEDIIELTWAPSCYRVTRMRWPDDMQGDEIYVLEEGKLQPRELDRILGGKTEVRRAVNKLKNTKENFITIKNDSCIVIGEKEEENITKRTHIIVNPTQVTHRTDNMLKLLHRIKQIHQKDGGCKPIKMYDATSCPATNRKIVEYIFRNVDENTKIYIKHDVTQITVNEQNVNKNNDEWTNIVRRRTNKQNTIIVQKGNSTKTFPQLLHTITDKIDPRKMSIRINKIIETKDGDIKIIFNGKEHNKTEQLRQEIENQTQLTTKTLQKNKTIIVRDLHLATENQDIMLGIMKQCPNIKKEDIMKVEIVNPKQGTNKRTKHAFVSLYDEAANKLLNEKSIIVLWGKCRIIEAISPPRCYVCYKYGHYSNTCKDPSKGAGIKGKCLQCTARGHTAKECTNPPKCYECNKDGHKAGTMGCDIFRDLVNQERKAMAAIKRKDSRRLDSTNKTENDILTSNEFSEAGSATASNRGQDKTLNRQESAVSVDSYLTANI
ncbi:hypothetical protein ABEB36_015535 [Hypothenemus hampei]|uniref:CCHC-type domain-containing protein n=1 Tax=Hypothenemus hampei TaxID=57062 RepID=A0ABD1E0B6_HYPHA